jgi:hypothetical protein
MANKPNPNINMILSSYQGILSDTIPLDNPMLISNEIRLNDVLLSSIAPKKPIQKEDGNWELEENTNDPFLNKEYKIDFLKQDIIVVRGAKIDKVNVIDGDYKVTYNPEPMKDYEYYAVIVKGPSGCAKPKGIDWLNEKPMKLHEAYDRIFIP